MMKNFKALAVILSAMSMCTPFSVMAANIQKEYIKEDWHSGLSGNGALIISLSVTGTFDWDSSTKKVKVYDVSGEVVDVNGGDISDKKTSTSGNNTSKATGTFSCKRTIWSGSTTYKVSVSCNYKGTNS